MLTITTTAVRIAIRVQPRSRHNRILGRQAGALKLQVCAPPVDGAANQAVIDLVAEWLAVPRRALTIVQGTSGRDKLLEVASDDPPGLARRIEAAAATCVDKPWGAD